MAQSIKTGTRIEVFCSHPQGRNEMAKIGRWTKVCGDKPNFVSETNGDWHIIVFDDGGRLKAHRSAFRIVDNR